MLSPPPATILFFPFDLLSHYLRCLQLASAIGDRYTVYFAHSKSYAKLVEQAGFATFPCAALDAAQVMQCARRFDFSWLEKNALEATFCSQVDSLKRLRPAAVLGDAIPTLKMAAEAAGIPYLALTNGYMTKYYQYVRRIARAHPAARFEDRLPDALFESMVKLGERLAFSQVHRPFKKLRRHYRLSRQRNYLDELEGDHNLVCDLPELFPQVGLPTHYRWLGPLFHLGSEAEVEVLDFLQTARPRLLVSMGSSGDFNRVSFLNTAAYAGYRIVVAGDSQGLLHGSHILEKPFINICALLDHIDLMLCHGGNGSIYQALSFGVPLLCAPSIFEQEWNLQGLERLGAGAALTENSDDKIRQAQFEYWMAQKRSPCLARLQRATDLGATKRNFRLFCEAAIPIAPQGQQSQHG